jgi:uncharacterized protein YggE
METNMNGPQNNLPKAIWLTIGGLVIAFLALSVVDKANNLFKSLSSKPENTISMSAEAKTTAVPDLATINVGVTSNASSAKLAADDVNTKIAQITDMVKQQGIDPKDITTPNYSVYPVQNYYTGNQKITGYTANETITIKVRGVDKSTDKVSKILDGATANGGNQIQGVYFTFNDPDSLKQNVRIQAIAKAKQKAQDLANASGLKLGKVVSVSEGNVTTPYPVPYALDAKNAMGGGVSSAPSIETGSQDITAQMTVVFELK